MTLVHEISRCAQDYPDLRGVLCPPYPFLIPLKEGLEGTSWSLGAQDCSVHSVGSFTGDIGAETLSNIGCSYVLIGHSERRFQETSDSINLKIERAHEAELTPIVCIGETEEEHNHGKTFHVLEKQLNISHHNIMIAYEPIWAIGTGKTPQSEDLEIVFQELKVRLSHVPLLYGGSVKGENIKEILSIPHVDGTLIGGASVNVTSFRSLCEVLYGI